VIYSSRIIGAQSTSRDQEHIRSFDKIKELLGDRPLVLDRVFMCDFWQTHLDFGVLALKSYYRGCKYATEMIKILPQKTNDILVAQLFRKIATLGGIHVAKSPFIRHNWRRYGLPLLPC